MTHSLAKGALIVLGCVVLAIAIVVGIKNGWIDLDGRPIHQVRELQPHVEERNRQIEELAHP